MQRPCTTNTHSRALRHALPFGTVVKAIMCSTPWVLTGQVLWAVPKSALLAPAGPSAAPAAAPSRDDSADHASPALLLSPTFVLPGSLVAAAADGAVGAASPSTTEWWVPCCCQCAGLLLLVCRLAAPLMFQTPCVPLDCNPASTSCSAKSLHTKRRIMVAACRLCSNAGSSCWSLSPLPLLLLLCSATQHT